MLCFVLKVGINVAVCGFKEFMGPETGSGTEKYFQKLLEVGLVREVVYFELDAIKFCFESVGSLNSLDVFVEKKN